MEDIIKYVVIGTIGLVVFNVLVNIFDYLKDVFSDWITEIKFRNQARNYVQQNFKNKKHAKKPLRYYGLYEFVLDNCTDEEAYKKECFSAIKGQMKSKYFNISCEETNPDKMFFYFNDFLQFDNIINDLIKFYDFYGNINRKSNIRTDLKFCIWTAPGEITTQKAYDKLQNLSNLNFVNQIITNDEIYKEYKRHCLGLFNFNSLGIVKSSENDEEVELYRLLKVSVSKGNHK